MPAGVPIPSVTPSVSPAPTTASDLWWSGYWAGFWVCFWLTVVVIVVAVAAYAIGKNYRPHIKAPKWWEHHTRKDLPEEKTPKLSGN